MCNILLNDKKSSMGYIKELSKYFWDSKIILNIRYEISKNVFILWSLWFFLNYFFVWAQFYDEVFFYTLPFSYFIFVVSFWFFIFFYLKNTFDLKFLFSSIVAIFILWFIWFFLSPFYINF